MEPWQIAVITAIVTGGGTWFTLRGQNRKLQAEGTDILVGSAKEVVALLREELDNLKDKVAQLEDKVNHLEGERTVDRELVGMLSQQLKDAGVKPVTRAQARRQLGLA